MSLHCVGLVLVGRLDCLVLRSGYVCFVSAVDRLNDSKVNWL